MTSAIGQNIPAPVQNRPASAQSAGESGPLAFDKILDGEKRAAPRQREAGHDHAPHSVGIDADGKTKSSAGTSAKDERHAWPILPGPDAAGESQSIRPGQGERHKTMAGDEKSAEKAQAARNGLFAALHAFNEDKPSPAKPDADVGAGVVAILPAWRGMAADAESVAAKHGDEKRSVRLELASEAPRPQGLASRPTAAPADAMSLQTAFDGDDAPPSLPSGPARERAAVAGERPLRLALPDARTPAAERVSVLAAQSIPAPAQHPIGRTALGVVEAIAGDHTWQKAAPPPGTAASQPGPGPAHMLKIELHPAELGTVQVGLRLAGGQLSIEITPQTHDAYRHLSSDTDAIARSMRDLGFDVGKVTLMQPALAVTASQRPDAGGAMTTAGREQSFQQHGHMGNGGSGGQQSGNSQGRDRNPAGHGWAPGGDRAGRGLVI
jgi:chemotaxis protein MotD